jgi:hypothetical protein
MPFSPWKAHRITAEGTCVDCGLKVPDGAVNPMGMAYSHGNYYSPNPAGRTAPCQPSTDK